MGKTVSGAGGAGQRAEAGYLEQIAQLESRTNNYRGKLTISHSAGLMKKVEPSH